MTDDELNKHVDAIAACAHVLLTPLERRAVRGQLRLLIAAATKGRCNCSPAGGLHMAFCPKAEHPGTVENGE